jgi:molybdate transport system regulatory protein
MMDKQDPPNLELRIRLVQAGAILMGPGRAELLALIQSTGSIAAAGRQMAMSYKRAWVLVEAMNHDFAAPLVEAAKGGPGGGGAKLTPMGLEVLNAYQKLQHQCQAATAAQIERLQRALPVSRRPKSG